MKKLFILLTVFCMVFFCSCEKSEPEIVKTADMLNITNEDADYLGCLERYNSVISAVVNKTSVLENAHNDKIKIESDSEYFFEDEYIPTSFEPFELDAVSVTNHFTPSMDLKQAEEIYKNISRGMTVEYSSDGTDYSLRFVSEELVEEYSAEYDEEFDSFRYIFSIEDTEETRTEEFLEFIKLENGAYAIQSQKSRCYVDFDEKGEIEFFACSTLRADEYSLDESIFPQKETLTSNWVTEKGKNSFESIHTYENGILTHSECSSGPWKTVSITAADFSSAFYM